MCWALNIQKPLESFLTEEPDEIHVISEHIYMSCR